MPTNAIVAVELEIERLGAVISAAEPWSPEYFKDPDSHALLIKQEAKLETIMRAYFRGLAERARNYVDWLQFSHQAIKAYEVNVVVTDTALDDEAGILINYLYDPLASMAATGAQAGEAIYKQPVDINRNNEMIIKAARKHAAELVTQINDTTRTRLRQSLLTSLELGEDNKAAVARLQTTLNDKKRAQTIVRTESVKAYQNGLTALATATDAIASEWQSLADATDFCRQLDGTVVKTGELFPQTQVQAPPLHVNCRCGRRLIYQVEVDANPDILSQTNL